MTETILRASSTPELLSVPAILLGFRPTESVVVMALGGKRVQFTARLDMSVTKQERRTVASQVMRAIKQFDGRMAIVVVAYTEQPTRGWKQVHQLVPLLGGLVVEGWISTSTHFWEVGEDPPHARDATPHDDSASELEARAVYEGLNVHASREAAVAAVQPPPAHLVPALAEALDETHAALVRLEEDELFAMVQAHAESTEALDEEAATQFAVLLQEPEVVGEILVRIDRELARTLRQRLVEARARVTDEFAPNVLGLLGMACWLSGEGAQQTDCMEQLAELAPGHPLLRLLEAVHGAGVPPSAWEHEQPEAGGPSLL